MSLRVNLFDATDGTVIDGDAVGPADAETARRDFRETVLAYFETDADGGQIRCLFAANEGDGDARPVLAQARWDHDGYAGVDKPAWANFTQFVTGEIETSNWSFVSGDLTESVFRKLNNRTIDPTEAGDSQLDRPLDGDTAHIRAPSTATAVAVFNHFARQEYDVPFSVAVCESVPAHLQDSLTILVTTDDRLAKPVVERFETEEPDQPETDKAEGGGADSPDPGGAKDGGATSPETDADDVPPAVGGSRRAVGGDSQGAVGSGSQPVAGDDSQSVADENNGVTQRETDGNEGVPRGSPRADELPDHTDRGPDDGETSTGDDATDRDRDQTNIPDAPAEQVDTADAPTEQADTADAPAEQADTADTPADDLADEEFPLLEEEEADAFLSGEQPDTTTDPEFESDADGTESKEFDTTIDFEGGDFDADFDTDAGFDGEELGDDGFDSSDSDGLGPLDTDEGEPSDAGGPALDSDEPTGNDPTARPADDFGDPADAAVPAEPDDPADAAVPAEPDDPTDATDPAEPDDPANVTDPAEPDDPANVTDPAEPDDPANVTDPAELDDPADSDDPDEHDPVAEFVAETETRPASDAIPESVRDDTPPGEADDSDATDTGDPVDTSDSAGTAPESVATDPLDTGPVGSTDPDFDEIDPDGSAVETTETHSGRSEAITGVAPEAAYELRLYSGPTGRLQYSTERESARVDSQAKWDYDNGLSLAVVPSEGVVRAYFNASRNGPEQFLAAFRCERVASEQLLETFVETLEATLAEQGWTLLEEAGGRQLLYNHMLTATPFDPDLSGADLADLLAEGPVDFVVPTHAKAVELFRWVREVADPETTIVVCGAGRTERTASADVVIQKDAGVGGVAVTGAAERRLEAQTLERAVRETTEAIRTVAEAVYREGGVAVGSGADGAAVGNEADGAAVGAAEPTDSSETDDGADAQKSDDEARLDTVIVDLLNDRVPDDQPLAFVADGSRARRYETAAGWGVVGYAATATVSLLLALVVGALDTQLAGLGTSVPITGTLVGGSDPPGWIPTVPLGVVLLGGLAVLAVAVAPSVASHPLVRGLLARVRSWWRYPPVSESALFDGSRIELLDATGTEETIESRLRRLGTAYDATQEEPGDYRQFVADTILTDPPLDSLSVAPRTETRRRQLSTVGGGAAVGVVLGVQTTVTLAVALGAAATTPGLAATITLLFVSVVGVIAAVRRVGDERVERLSSVLDELR